MDIRSLQEIVIDGVKRMKTALDPIERPREITEDFQSQRFYHYTNATGLIGILENKCLWGTHFRYLNDYSEITHGLDWAVLLVRERSKKSNRVARKMALTVLGEDFDEFIRKSNVFLACFCTESNLLSQWRAYGEGGGFAIGFKPRIVKKHSRKPQFHSFDGAGYRLAKVVYDDSKKKKLMNAIVDRFFGSFERIVAGISDSQGGLEDDVGRISDEQFFKLIEPLSFEFFTSIYAMCCYFKHESFKQECEWRFVSFEADDGIGKDVAFRPSGGLPVPYTTFPIGCDNKDEFCFEVESVTCGPSSQEEKKEHSVRMLLDRFGYNNVKIEHSRIPLTS